MCDVLMYIMAPQIEQRGEGKVKDANIKFGIELFLENGHNDSEIKETIMKKVLPVLGRGRCVLQAC